MNFLKKYYWAIVPIIGWLIVRFGFNFNGLYGQDAYAYLLHAREWKAFFLGGETPRTFFWPPNYSIIGALLSLLIKTEFYSLQLVSVFSMMGLAGILNRWIKEAYPEFKARSRIALVSLGFLLSPYMFRLGMQCMSDMLAMVFLTASFYQLWKSLQDDSAKSLLLWSGFSALAITTRYPAIVVLLPTIGYIGFRLLLRVQLGKLAAGIIVGAIPISVAVWWKLTSGGMDSVVGIDLIQNWDVSNFWHSEFSTSDTNSKFILPNVLFNLSPFIHPGTMFFGVVLLPLAITGVTKNRFKLLLLASVLVYACFLAGVPFQNSRVATFTYPLIVMFYLDGFEHLSDWLKEKNIPGKLMVTVAALVQLGLCTRAMAPSVLSNHFERQLATWIQTNHGSKSVYTSSYSQLFDVYETGNSVIQIFDSEINQFETGSLFIFNQSWAEFKLKGTMPLQNWEKAQSEMQVEELKCWENGWCVYSLNSK